MLKKLIKHDLKYGVRMFAVLHIILIIGCLMARFLVIDHLDFSADPEEFAPVIALLIVVLTMLFSAISFGCCIMYAVRFYKNLFTDEGYITHASGVTADPALGEDSVCLHLVCAGSYNLLCRCVVFDFGRQYTVCSGKDQT